MVGQLQLDVLISRLEAEYKVEAVLAADPEVIVVALAGGALGVPLGVALHPAQLYEAAAELIIFLILYRHAGNIRRLLSGTEPRLGEGKR